MINQAHVNTGHAGLDETYVELSNQYHWQNSYTETKEFVESCDLYQLTKSRTQKPVGLLTSLKVPTRPWIDIAMGFLLLKQLIVDCTKLIPALRLSDQQKPHSITLYKFLNIVDRQSGHTYIIPCTAEIDVDGVIDIFKRLMKPTVGLPVFIV